MIEIKNLTVKYRPEFDNITNFSINIDNNTLFIADEIWSTSLFRSIMNIDKFKGEIIIDGILNKSIKKDYPVSYVPETPTLFNNKTARKNIAYTLKIRGYEKKDIDDKINTLEHMYNLTFLDKKVRKLSSDEKLITTLLRATIHEPKYIIIENLFSRLNEFKDTAKFILDDSNSLIIASEEDENIISFFENYKEIIKK